MNTKGSDTLVGRLRKVGMYPAIIYFFIFFFFFFFNFFFFLIFFFFFFFVRMSLECKDVEY